MGGLAKHCGGSVMVWGAFADQRTGDLIQVSGIMKKEQYLSIMRRNTTPSGLRIIGKITFQQETDSKHSFKLCQIASNQ